MDERAVTRKLATILVADVVGFSRLTAEDERWTISSLADIRIVVDEIIARHDGRIFNTGGDSVLAEFNSPVEAVRCAVDTQEAARSRNLVQPRNRQLRFRIGINLGDVIVRGSDLLGDGVNVAARLESLAEPGGICVSGTVWDQIYGKLSLGYVDMGEQRVKNIPRPVRAYQLRLDGTIEDLSPMAGSPTEPPVRRDKKPRLLLPAATATVVAVLVGGSIAWQFWIKRSEVPVQPPATVSIATSSATGVGAGLPAVQSVAPLAAMTKPADTSFWLNGNWAVILSKSPVTDPAFCSQPAPPCRYFEVDHATGDGDYEVGWGYRVGGDSIASFTVRGKHVSAILPSDSHVEMQRGEDGDFNGKLVNPQGIRVLIRARKLPGS